MAAPNFDNVIRFPEAGAVSASSGEKLLADARDLAARRLREMLREIVEKLADTLQERGDVAVDRDQRSFLHGLRGTLVGHGGRLEAQLAGHWIRDFDTARMVRASVKPSEMRLEDLQIVDDSALTEELALKSLASKLEELCQDELYGVGRRLSALAGRSERSEAGEVDNPAGPVVFCKALQGALIDIDLQLLQRIELYHCIEPYLAERMTPIYHEINSMLVRHDILPALRRGYGRAPGHSRDADKQRDAANVPSGDIFSMLQKLVAAPGSGATPGSANAAMAGGAVGSGGGTGQPGAIGNMPGASSGNQALAMDRVLASLDALQRSLPAAMPVANPAASASASMPLPITVGTNVLHEFRASEVGQGLAQLDAITVDIVSMLFDLIFDDRAIADPIKALVGRLQIPVLKVAMLDKSFFSSRAHPARRLLDVISKAAVRWGREVGRDDPIYWKIAQIIARLHDEFSQDTTLFDTLCVELEAFLADQEDAEDIQAARAAPMVVQREQEELGALAVDEAIRPWLSDAVPLAVMEILQHEWRKVLVQVRRESGPDSEAWKAAVQTMADLVGSVQNKSDVQERRALSRLLPHLVKQIAAGFARIGVTPERRKALFDSLFTLHSAVMRDSPPPPVERVAAPSVVPVEPELTSISLVDGDVEMESISVSDSIEAAARSDAAIEDLRRGDWVEFNQQSDDPIRYRLSWVSPQRGIYLFTNPKARALSVSPDALVVKLERGEARIVAVEPIFERAVSRALESMHAT
jgi:hypothetical protein